MRKRTDPLPGEKECVTCGGEGKIDRYNLCPVCEGTRVVDDGPEPD